MAARRHRRRNAARTALFGRGSPNAGGRPHRADNLRILLRRHDRRGARATRGGSQGRTRAVGRLREHRALGGSGGTVYATASKAVELQLLWVQIPPSPFFATSSLEERTQAT